MDILSAISGIITLLGGGGTIVQGLERLSSLRDAPNTILALNNEVSDFRVAVLKVLSILQQESVRSSVPRTYNDDLDSILRRAQDKLVELESLIEYRLLAPTTGSEIRLNKGAWFLERHRVKRIQEEIRSIRINLTIMLGILNINSVSRLEVYLSGMCLVGTTVQDQLGQTLSRTDTSFHTIRTQLAQIQNNHIAELQLLNRLYGSAVQHQQPPESSRQSDASQRRRAGTAGDGFFSDCHDSRDIPPLLILTRIHQHHLVCMPACTCRCHRIRSWKSPQWLQYLLGFVFTGYVGIPLVSPSCDDKFCQRQSQPAVTVQYHFPPWFASQVFQFYIQLSKHDGITQSLRTYRVVWKGSELFKKTEAGDLEGVQAILASRQGSPFDVTDSGFTALAVAVGCGHVEICRVLLQADADPYQTNQVGRSVTSYAWTEILGKSYNEEATQALQAIMPALDLPDYEFTPLHLAVLGLSSSTVTEVLRHYPSFAINAGDSFGRTALWWAARRGDYHAMELLLDHHADPDKSDCHGYYPVTSAIAAQSGRCLGLLLKSGVDINRKDYWGYTPLSRLAQRCANPTVLDVLLQYNPDLNARGRNGDSALFFALTFQHYDIATRLIQVGADIQIRDNAGYNALSVATLHNAHTLVQMLRERQADHHGSIKQYGTLLHLIAETADAETLRILTNRPLATRDVRVKRSNGQTAIEVAKARPNTTIEWQNAFFAFIWSVDRTKTRVSPFTPSGNQARAADSDGEEDALHDALE